MQTFLELFIILSQFITGYLKEFVVICCETHLQCLWYMMINNILSGNDDEGSAFEWYTVSFAMR